MRERIDLTLGRAADLIEEHGWLQGQMGDVGRGFCLLGAVYEGVDYAMYSHDPGSYGLIVEGALRRVRRVVGNKMVGWNDSPGRTREEVVAALRTAASLPPVEDDPVEGSATSEPPADAAG